MERGYAARRTAARGLWGGRHKGAGDQSESRSNRGATAPVRPRNLGRSRGIWGTGRSVPAPHPWIPAAGPKPRAAATRARRTEGVRALSDPRKVRRRRRRRPIFARANALHAQTSSRRFRGRCTVRSADFTVTAGFTEACVHARPGSPGPRPKARRVDPDGVTPGSIRGRRGDVGTGPETPGDPAAEAETEDIARCSWPASAAPTSTGSARLERSAARSHLDQKNVSHPTAEIKIPQGKPGDAGRVSRVEGGGGGPRQRSYPPI